MRLSLKLLQVVLLLSVWATVACSDSPQYLDPTSSDSDFVTGTDDETIVRQEAALLIVPEPGVSVAVYQAVAARLAADSSGRVAVEVLDFGGGLPSPELLAERASKSVAQQAATHGAELGSEDVILLAYGVAGESAAQVVQSSAYGGLVLVGGLGSVDPAVFPAPLLFVAGELDGDFSLFHLASLPGQITQNPEAEAAVAVLPGVNRGQLKGGADLAGDLEPDVTDEEALAALSQVVQAFLEAHFLSPADDDSAAAASQILDDRSSQAEALFLPFNEALRLQNEQWCLVGQAAVPALPAAQSARLSISATVFPGPDDFYGNQPTLETVSKKGQPSQVQLGVLHYTRPRDKRQAPWASAVSVACKLRSATAVREALDLDTNQPEVSCGDLNLEALRWALSAVPPAVAQRYSLRGIELSVADDASFITGIQWKTAELQWKSNKAGVVTVSSPALVTSTWIPVLGGMHYCKLLSPASALEWVWLESLRDAPSF